MNLVDFIIVAILVAISLYVVYRKFKKRKLKCNGCCDCCPYKN